MARHTAGGHIEEVDQLMGLREAFSAFATAADGSGHAGLIEDFTLRQSSSFSQRLKAFRGKSVEVLPSNRGKDMPPS